MIKVAEITASMLIILGSAFLATGILEAWYLFFIANVLLFIVALKNKLYWMCLMYVACQVSAIYGIYTIFTGG